MAKRQTSQVKRKEPGHTRATSLADLQADPVNRRTHPERNLAMTVQALQAVGAARSIVIDESDTVLAGNGVTEAARAAGITKLRIVDVDGDTLVAVRRTGLTPDQKRQLALFDNRTSELAEWNLAQLAADLKNGDDLGAYFFDAELARLGVIGEQVENVKGEWGGMPTYAQSDERGFHTLHVHFKDAEAMAAFGQLIGRALTTSVRYLWVPDQEPSHAMDREDYVEP